MKRYDDIPLAVISGPTFAKELAAGLPTAISLAYHGSAVCGGPSAPTALRQKLPRLHQPGLYRRAARRRGEKRHIVAVGAGMSDGIGFGANARTALITRGLVEMSRLGAALGADPETFMGILASVTWCSPAPTTSPVTVALHDARPGYGRRAPRTRLAGG